MNWNIKFTFILEITIHKLAQIHYAVSDFIFNIEN